MFNLVSSQNWNGPLRLVYPQYQEMKSTYTDLHVGHSTVFCSHKNKKIKFVYLEKKFLIDFLHNVENDSQFIFYA